MVSHLPFGIVSDSYVFGQGYGLGEVDEPHVGVVAVVHEKQRASYHLKKKKEGIFSVRYNSSSGLSNFKFCFLSVKSPL